MSEIPPYGGSGIAGMAAVKTAALRKEVQRWERFSAFIWEFIQKNESQDHFDRMLSRLFSDPDVMRYQV